MVIGVYTRTVAKSTKIEDAPISGRHYQQHIAELLADFDPAVCPIIARHFFGLLQVREVAA